MALRDDLDADIVIINDFPLRFGPHGNSGNRHRSNDECRYDTAPPAAKLTESPPHTNCSAIRPLPAVGGAIAYGGGVSSPPPERGRSASAASQEGVSLCQLLRQTAAL